MARSSGLGESSCGLSEPARRYRLTVSAGPAMLDVESAMENAANAQRETSMGQFEQAGCR